MNVLWIAELVQDGLRNLLRHRLRSTLTLLGVVFGVAAVITMLGIGEGAQRTVLKEISALGLNNIIVDSVQPPATSLAKETTGRRGRVLEYGVTRRDVEQVRTACAGSTVAVAHLVKRKVYYGSKRIDCKTLGVSPDYFRLFRTRLLRGRLITAVDDLKAHKVAVVTESVGEMLNIRNGARGNVIRVGKDYLQVVGVVRVPSQGTSELIFMPYRTARTVFGSTTIKREAGSIEFTKTEIGQLIVHVADESIIPETSKVVRRTLEENHEHADFSISVPLDILRSKQRTQRILNLVLVTIAGISLVVGGIGIMNIMLAVVTERIPEIGVRRAIGARRADIVLQFLAETVTLASLGGIAGCVLGAIAVPLASTWTGWPGIITPLAVTVSLSVSWAVGLVFGIAPAVRASKLDPVEALRYE